MDLNQPPPDDDEDFFNSLLDLDNVPLTQVLPYYENSQPAEQQQDLPSIHEGAQGGLTDAAEDFQEEAQPSVSEIRLSLEGVRLEDVNVAENQEAEEEEEVWSTPEMPHNGMTFGSVDEARQYYNKYAARKGFSIRNSTSYRSGSTKEIQKVQFVCNKEGTGKKKKADLDAVNCYSDNDEPHETYAAEEVDETEEDGQEEKRKKLDGCKKRKREKMTCTNCKARMVVKLIGSRWHVIYFVAEHNHELVLKPSLKKFLRSHRGIPKQEKDFIVLLHGCNLSTGRIMQLMTEFYGSAQLVPYEAKQVTNFRSTIHKIEKFRDMQETLDYFRSMKEQDPDFFYRIKLDENHKVQNLFWVDSAARRAYREAYSDCISFDATYMTNMYEMPFTPFIGINRHCQTFQLGCAFIRNEKTETYEWLFATFLEAMDGKAPMNIITDQDGAMRNAICSIFPNTTHRNCRWHIMDKFSGTIGPILSKDEELNEEFKDCINHTVTPEEFESNWAAMLQRYDEKYGLKTNEHFHHLYQIRKSFIPAYYMHSFFPFLQSTQRSEGFNGLLKKYVNPNLSVFQFIMQYQKIQEKCLVCQDGQDFRTEENQRRRWSNHPLERHASAIYTKNMFYRFSREFERTAEYDVRQAGQFQYWVEPNNISVFGYGRRNYLVTAIQEEESYCCECSKFDRDGIICCHIMRVMIRMGVKSIPERYILKRWTQEAIPSNTDHVQGVVAPVELVARGMPLNSEKTLRPTNASTALAALAAEGCTTDDNYAVLERHIKQMRAEFGNIRKKKMAARQAAASRQQAEATNQQAASNEQVAASNLQAALPNQHASVLDPSAPNTRPTVSAQDGLGSAEPTESLLQATGAEAGPSSPNMHNPPKSKHRGRKREKRLKKGMDAQPKRKNKCSICRSYDHNARKCPNKLSREVQSQQTGLN